MVLISNTTDQYLIGQDCTAYFSQSSDFVDAEAGNEMIRGKHTLMHSGDDTYLGTSFNSLGWDNVVSGNRGKDSLVGSWAMPSRDFFRGGKDDYVLDGGTGGSDFLHGAWGDDDIWGSNASSILCGGKVDDWIRGGQDRDLLMGAVGKDELQGDGGSDLFMLRPDETQDGYANMAANVGERTGLLILMLQRIM